MIAIGSDHGGYSLKEQLKKHMDTLNIEYKDYGAYSTDSVDYPEIAKQVTQAIQKKECEKGILICRSGYGMAMVANKFKGIRSAPCFSVKEAEFSRRHNDINLLALGADYVSINNAKKILEVWNNTKFDGGRHKRRIEKILNIE